MHIVFFAYLKIEKWRTKSMFMNILVGIMAAIAILAGVWGFWVDHRRDRHPGIFFLDKYFFIAVRYV